MDNIRSLSIKRLLSATMSANNNGTGHFIWQRLSALVLIPLVIWFCLSIAFLPDASYANAIGWLSSPFNAVLMCVVLMTGFYHGALGMQTIFEDYISSEPTRHKAILISNLLLFLFAVVGIFSILNVAFSN